MITGGLMTAKVASLLKTICPMLGGGWSLRAKLEVLIKCPGREIDSKE